MDACNASLYVALPATSVGYSKRIQGGALLKAHNFRSIFCLIFVSKEMESPVYRQHCQFVLQIQAMGACLALRRVDGDYDVAEDLLCSGQPRDIQFARLSFALGKGEDVRGFVLAAIIAIHLVDSCVIGEEDAYLSPGSPLRAKGLPDG